MNGMYGLGLSGFMSTAPAPATAPLHRWQGASGRWYPHSVYTISEIPDFGSANYIFARKRSDGLFDPLYIGQSGELDKRLRDHEKLAPAIRLGATHIHVHLLAKNTLGRLDVETDLRRNFSTPLNEQGSPLNAVDVLSNLGLAPSHASLTHAFDRNLSAFALGVAGLPRNEFETPTTLGLGRSPLAETSRGLLSGLLDEPADPITLGLGRSLLTKK